MQFDMAPEGSLGGPKMVNIQGRQHPSADGLIDRSHRGSTDRGLYCVGSTIKAFVPPSPDNNFTAMVHFAVRYVHPNDPQTEFVWEDLGDANTQNCGAQVAPHFIRMASTRALSRAHGQALNIAEAVAEEIANGGTGQQAVNNYQQQGQAAQPQYQQQQAPPQQGSVAPGQIQQMFPGVASWKFTVRTGANAKKQIDDPTVTLEDLQFHLQRGFFSKNPQTQIYDVQDTQSAQIYQAEIARRMGGHINVPQQQQPVQQPQGVPNYGQAAPQQAQPQYQQPPMAQQPQQDLNWSAQNNMPKLLNASKAYGAIWPDVLAWCAGSFGGKPPMQLSRDEFDMAMVAFGGQPLS